MKLFNLKFKNNQEVKMLDIIFNSVQGEPFEIQQFQHQNNNYKIELYYIEQSTYKNPLINSRQFVVYTADKGFFRILLDKEYYEKFNILYQKDINVIWVKFMMSLFQQQLKFEHKYFYNITIFFVISILLLIVTWWQKDSENHTSSIIILTLAVLIPIIGTLFIIKKQKKHFMNLKNDKLNSVINKIKNIIGTQQYEKILQEQKNYQPKSFLDVQNNKPKVSKK